VGRGTAEVAMEVGVREVGATVEDATAEARVAVSTAADGTVVGAMAADLKGVSRAGSTVALTEAARVA